MKRFYHSTAAALGLGMLFLTGSTTMADAATSSPTITKNSVTYILSAGTELMTGDTTYQIGYPVTTPSGVTFNDGHFPISELAWPLDIWLARLEGHATLNNQWRLNGTLKKNLTTPGDNMADSDWLTAGNPGRLDVYSESEISSFDAFIMDVDVDWTFMRRNTISFYAGLGLLYQNFNYDGKLIHQYSPSGLSGAEYYGDGSVAIAYEMTYTMPYLKLGTDLQVTPKFALAGSLSYSPLVNAEDTDEHLLRNKISSGDMDGNAYMFDFSGKYMFTPALFLEAGFHYLNIQVDGTSDQSFYGVPYATVTEESESTQTSGNVSIGFKF